MKFFIEVLYDTQHGIMEFHFERTGFTSAEGYRVTVVAGTDETYNFTMQEGDGKWLIDDAAHLPEWLLYFESILSDSIYAHLGRILA